MSNAGVDADEAYDSIFEREETMNDDWKMDYCEMEQCSACDKSDRRICKQTAFIESLLQKQRDEIVERLYKYQIDDTTISDIINELKRKT